MNLIRKIFHFNPTCEIAIANGSPYYQAPALLRNFEEELAPILLFFANENDHVLKETAISTSFAESLTDLGISPANLFSRKNSMEMVQQETVRLNPWGWSPAEQNYLTGYNQQSEDQIQTSNLLSSNIFERKHSVYICNELFDNNLNSIFPRPEQRPCIFTSTQEVEHYLSKHHQIVLKSPLSSSGRGLQVIRKNKLNESNIRWIKTTLQQQNYLVAEPLFNKKMDLSFQFEVNYSGKIAYLGISYFTTNQNGQYAGHFLNPTNSFKNNYFSETELHEISNQVMIQLQKSVVLKMHRGFIGVDALIFEEAKQVKIQPCIEINPRYNMGILSKFIEKRIHPESTGTFQVYYHPNICYKEFAESEAKKNQKVLIDQFVRKGFISLTSPTPTSKFGAYLNLI